MLTFSITQTRVAIIANSAWDTLLFRTLRKNTGSVVTHIRIDLHRTSFKFDLSMNLKHMKNNSAYFFAPVEMRSYLLITMVILSLACARAQNDPASSSRSKNEHDPEFPGRRNFNAGVLTTYTTIAPPPAIIGDITYGINNRMSVGLMAGTTGAQSLTGLKFSAELFRRNDFRMMYRMIIVYYPGRRGEYLFDNSEKRIIPWMLSMGVIDAEWKSEKGIRWSIGMGLLETHCVIGMKRFFWGGGDEEEVMPFEFFHTVQGSVSVPVSRRLTLRPEVFIVMRNAQLIRTGEAKVFPVNPFIKLIHTF